MVHGGAIGAQRALTRKMFKHTTDGLKEELICRPGGHEALKKMTANWLEEFMIMVIYLMGHTYKEGNLSFS